MSSSAISAWTHIFRRAASGRYGPRFPQGQFIDLDGDETDSGTYNVTMVWEPCKGGAFKTIQITIFVDPNPRRIYGQLRHESLEYQPWRLKGPSVDGWNTWPAGFPAKADNPDIWECGTTNGGSKVAWVQEGRKGKVMVLLQSLAGHGVLSCYSESVCKAVRETLK